MQFSSNWVVVSVVWDVSKVIFDQAVDDSVENAVAEDAYAVDWVVPEVVDDVDLVEAVVSEVEFKIPGVVQQDLSGALHCLFFFPLNLFIEFYFNRKSRFFKSNFTLFEREILNSKSIANFLSFLET